MVNEYNDLSRRIIEELRKNPGQSVKELAKHLKVNRIFLAGYLKALENQGYIRSKKIGPAKVYFREGSKR
ncbi:MAG: winged helix-turn-helix transcriptional regulator [Candidatus Aenigmatarchaeota archaeon]